MEERKLLKRLVQAVGDCEDTDALLTIVTDTEKLLNETKPRLRIDGLMLVDPDVANLDKKSKKQLIEFIYLQTRFYNTVGDGIIQVEEEKRALEKEVDAQRDKVSQSEEKNCQARAMIEAIMERWYDYDD